MTQDNVPRELREGRQRLDEGLSDDDDFELVEVLENVVDEVLEQGETDDEAEDDIGDIWNYQPSKDDAIHTHSHHKGSVFACDIHPEGKIIASGGEDDRFILTEVSSGNILLDCNNYFQDSVTMVGFNHDGKYVFGCDMMGLIAVWKVLPSGFSCVFKETVGGLTPSSWAKWHPKSNVLLIGGHSVWLYKVPSGQCKLVHEGTTETDSGDFMPDGKRAVIGFEDGTVKVIDLATGGTNCKFAPESTQLSNILSVAIHPDNNLIAVGAMNSKLALFKTQQPKTVAVLDCAEDIRPLDQDGEEQEEYVTSTESAVFVSVDGMNVLVVGTDHAVHVWDYTRLVLRHKIAIDDGVTRIIWPENSLFIFVGTRLGTVNVYNALSGEKQPSLEGHKSSILDIHLSSDKRHLITSGDDGAVKMFDISQILRI
uniref:Angio-associated migratory cell protein n=2 Tax=Lygus hesperus TaxID=30085 RepID=A0A0K8T2H8_LYGHE